MQSLRHLEKPLSSNGYLLSTAADRLGTLNPSPADLPIEIIRELFALQGYVWLKGFFDKDDVLSLRKRFFNAYVTSGLLQRDSDPTDGFYSGIKESGSNTKTLMEFVRTACYESFCLQEKLWQFYDKFFEGPSYLHKRKIVRYKTPHNATQLIIGHPTTTPAHYDLIYLRGGNDKVVSSWIPLGDTPIEMGGLVYLEGSALLGKKMEAEFSLNNKHLTPEERISAYNKNMTEGGWIGKDLGAMAETFNARWLVADYEAGDMVIHSPYMIHAATDNVDAMCRIRLSTDIRYQSIREELDVRWENHWTLEDML